MNQDQIAELKRKLPLVRAFLVKPPRRQDVRDALQSLDDAIVGTQKNLKLLKRAKLDYLREAQARLTEADDKDATPQARVSLGKLREVVRRAIDRLPREQSRHRTASHIPVFLIWQALVAGYAKEHRLRHEEENKERRRSDLEAWRGLTHPLGHFRKVVGICYEAIGMDKKHTKPERAIKAFASWRHKRYKAQGDKIPRKIARQMGRQVGEKT